MQFFEKHAFLEFFDTEKIIDKEVNISIFSVSLIDDSTLSMYISPHEECVSLKLTKKNIDLPIFEIGLSQLSNISCDLQWIHFFRIKNQSNVGYQDIHLIQPFWSLRVKPTVHFQLDL